MLITHIEGLIALLITTPEPPRALCPAPRKVRGGEGRGGCAREGEGQVRSPCRGLGALGASQDTDSSDTKGGFLKDRRSKSSLEISQTLRSTLG